MSKTPRNTIKIRRGMPSEGDEITVRVRVTRVGRNTWDTGDIITVKVPGAATPVTVPADILLDAQED